MAETAADATGAFREGDWYCERCGDHQFERNLMCRKCAAPKPMVSTNNQASKAGDWICPNPQCMDLQFERNMVCRKCGSGRPAGTLQKAGADGQGELGGSSGGETAARPMGNSSAVFAPDDWMCPACGDHQFAKNQVCRRCGGPKPGAKIGGGQVPKAGDWICTMCKDLQFERNVACRRCGAPKPANAMPATAVAAARPMVTTFYAPNVQPRTLPAPSMGGPMGMGGAKPNNMAPEDWICGACGDHQFARNLQCRKCSAPKPTVGAFHQPYVSTNRQTAKMGDWICPNPACKDVQFEKNHICRRCGTAKPLTPQAAVLGGVPSPVAFGGMVGMGRGGMYGGKAPPLSNGRPLRPGDWTCPNPSCRDIQFEKNQVCRLCGSAKPTVASNKQVFKAGDWICPNADCRDVQFERNTVCRQCGSAKPSDAELACAGEGRARSRSPARAAEAA